MGKKDFEDQIPYVQPLVEVHRMASPGGYQMIGMPNGAKVGYNNRSGVYLGYNLPVEGSEMRPTSGFKA